VNLVLDLGNTLHKCAVFEGEQLIHLEAHQQLLPEHIEQISSRFPIQSAIISSVDHYDEHLEAILQESFHLVVLSHTTSIPIQNNYGTPTTLGKDRLSAAVGGFKAFPGQNVLVIDAGTCIKYDFITAAGNYMGGAISPGLTMRLKAMHNFTARLPLIEPTAISTMPKPALTGDSTTNSMLSGALNGALMEVEGAIGAYRDLHGDIAVIISGGDAPFFELHLKSRIFARPNVVLEGLNTILNYNLNN
jgi:type III pantothenate kinase